MRGFSVLALTAMAATMVKPTHAGMPLSHNGGSDPSTEGWTVEPSFAPYGRPSSGAVINDRNSGYDAWSIDDDLATIGSNWLYVKPLTTDEVRQARTQGWALRARLRLGDSPDSIGNAGAVMLEYADGVSTFRLALGAQSNGDPIALLWDGGLSVNGSTATGSNFILHGGGAGYHLYEIIYDPHADSVCLLIDGIERIRDYAGAQSSLFRRVAWGSGSSSDTGESNWNWVQWEILPAELRRVCRKH